MFPGLLMMPWFRAKDVRIVRLLLSSPHEQNEDSMTTRSSLPRTVKEPQIVLPSTYTQEEDKLGSSSRWKRDHLKLLGVDFYAKSKLDLNRVLGERESEWSSELQASTLLLLYLVLCVRSFWGRQIAGSRGHEWPLQWRYRYRWGSKRVCSWFCSNIQNLWLP